MKIQHCTTPPLPLSFWGNLLIKECNWFFCGLVTGEFPQFGTQEPGLIFSTMSCILAMASLNFLC